MKRITTAAVAAATALSLVATPAFAEDNKDGSSNENQGSSQQQDKEGDKGGSSKDGETKKKSSELTDQDAIDLSLIHISEPTRPVCSSRMPSSA